MPRGTSSGRRWWSSSGNSSGTTTPTDSKDAKASEASRLEEIYFAPMTTPTPYSAGAPPAQNIPLSVAAPSPNVPEAGQTLGRDEGEKGKAAATASTSPTKTDGSLDGTATGPRSAGNNPGNLSPEGAFPGRENSDGTATVSSPTTAVYNGGTSLAAASGGAAAAAIGGPPPGYQSYADERFFTRLRASLDLAAWEVHKTVEGGVCAAAQAAQEANLNMHMGVHAAVSAGRTPLVPRAEGAETGEQAALRLAERVHSMTSTGATRNGGDNSRPGVVGGGDAARVNSGGITGFFLPPLERKTTE